jgi:hypothetical protein
MSNDDTHNDDSTVKLPDDEAKYDTKPGITAVLERINQLGEQLNKKIDDAVAEVRSDIAELRAEMQAGFEKLDRRLDVLSDF